MNKKKINILLVENEESHAHLICRSFESIAEQVSVTVACNLNEARNSISKTTPDLMIADFLLPDGKGIELIQANREESLYPVIILTSHGDEKIAVEAMKAGAFDYIVKSEVTLDNMPRICERVLRECKHITNSKRAEEKYRRLIENLRDNYFFYMHNVDGVFTYISPSLTNILGYSSEEFLTHYSEYLTDNPINKEVMEHTELSIKGIKQPPYEIEIYHNDGSIRSLQVQEVPIFDDNRKVVAVEGIAQDITERNQVEEALSKSEEKYRILIETAHDAIFTIDIETGIILDANMSAEEMLGIPVKEIVGMHHTQTYPPKEVKHTEEIFKKYVQNGKGITTEDIFVQHRDGRKIPVEISCHVFELGGEKIIQGIFRDITERKKSERRLSAQHAVIKVLSESTTVKEASPKILQAICEALEWDLGEIWEIDQQKNVLYNSEIWHVPSLKVPEFTATRQITFPPEIGLPGRVWESAEPLWIADVVHDTNFPRASVADKEGLHGAFGFPIIIGSEVLGTLCFFSREIRKPDNNLLDMMTAIGRQIGLFIKRKRSEEELLESEKKSLLLLNSTGEAIYGLDLEGNCTFCNPSCLCLLGYEHESQLLGRNMHALIHHTRKDGTPYPEEECCIYQAFREGKGTHVDDEVLWRADGTGFAAEYRSFPIFREGETVGSVVSFVDITERKKAEKEIKGLAKFPNENPNPVIRVFNDGNILYHNKASTFLLDFWGCQTTKILPDNYIKIVSDVLHSGLSSDAETECKDRVILLTFAPIVEEGYVNIYGMDITERRKMEKELIKAQKLESVGVLAGGIAHDFNNSLQAILGYITLAKMHTSSNNGIHEYLEEAGKVVLQSRGLTQQLLTFSKGGAPVKKSIFVSELVMNSTK
ncbi:MAG: PAS domain S-box protein, partial [Candidatus Scalindua sp.]